MDGSTHKRRRRGAACTVSLFAAASLALIAAPGASAEKAPGASAEKLGGGATTLSIDSGVADALQSNGVKVAPILPAEAGGKGLSFPITDGTLTTGKKVRGYIDHSGGLKVSAGGTDVSLTDFRVVIGKKSFLVASVGNGKLRVFSLRLKDAKITKKGEATVISGVRAELTKAAATALNGAFDTDLFSPGLFVGKVKVKAKPPVEPVVALAASGRTTLVLDPGAAGALASLHITPSPIAPATAATGGLAFPITGGSVNTETLAGEITHGGGLRLTKGHTNVDLTDFTIQIDDAPDLTALVGGSRVSILTLDLSQAQAQVNGKEITVSGVRALLTADAATALNGAFSTHAFTPGLLLGTATVEAVAK